MDSGDEVIAKMLVARGGIKTGPEFGSEGRPAEVFPSDYDFGWVEWP